MVTTRGSALRCTENMLYYDYFLNNFNDKVMYMKKFLLGLSLTAISCCTYASDNVSAEDRFLGECLQEIEKVRAAGKISPQDIAEAKEAYENNPLFSELHQEVGTLLEAIKNSPTEELLLRAELIAINEDEQRALLEKNRELIKAFMGTSTFVADRTYKCLCDDKNTVEICLKKNVALSCHLAEEMVKRHSNQILDLQKKALSIG